MAVFSLQLSKTVLYYKFFNNAKNVIIYHHIYFVLLFSYTIYDKSFPLQEKVIIIKKPEATFYL